MSSEAIIKFEFTGTDLYSVSFIKYDGDLEVMSAFEWLGIFKRYHIKYDGSWTFTKVQDTDVFYMKILYDENCKLFSGD